MISIRNKLKRISALTLACLTAISSPLTSFADTGVGGNASGSSTGGVVTSSGSMQGACAASRRRTRCKGKARGAAPARSRASLKRGRGG